MDHRNSGERLRSLLLQLVLVVGTVVLASVLFQQVTAAMSPMAGATGG